MITPPLALNVIGQRGLIPAPSLVNTAFELIDRGQGIEIRFWDSDALGPEPSQSELDLAANPLISLQLVPTETGVNAIAQTVNAGYTGLLFWRCIDPDGQVYEAQDNAVNGGDNWEVDMGKVGVYIFAVWATNYGYVQEVASA